MAACPKCGGPVVTHYCERCGHREATRGPRRHEEDPATQTRGDADDERPAMIQVVIEWAMSQRARNGIAKAVLLALAGQADEHGRAHVSHRSLAAETGFCVRAVRNGLNTLEAGGFVQREARHDEDGGQISNAVQLLGLPTRRRPRK